MQPLSKIKKMSMRAKLINEKFTEDSDPIKDMGIGLSLYEQYIKLIEQNDHLVMHYRGGEKEFQDPMEYNNVPDAYVNRNSIVIRFYREHPMSGQFGRTSYLSYDIKIKFIKNKYRVIGNVYEEGYTKFKEEFNTLKEALEFIIPVLNGIHSYY